MSKFLSMCSKLILYFFLFFLGLIVVSGNITNGILLTIFSVFFLLLFVKKSKIKNFSLFLIVISLLIKIIGIFIIKVPVRADYKLMYDASLNVLNGDLAFTKNYYFSFFSYQLGHVFYQALLLKVFNSIFILKLLNCIYSTIITLLIYLLVRR